MNTPGQPLDELSIRELELLLASARDQYNTAAANWRKVASSDAPLSDTLPWAGAVNAAERRFERVRKELARRQQGAAA